MTDPTKKLFVLPAFNEADNLGSVLADLAAIAQPDQIVVVNDGSEDDTAAVARSAGVHCLDFAINVGVSSAVRAGFRFAIREGNDIVIQFDADGQHLALEAEKIIEAVTRGDCDVAIGARKSDLEETSTFFRRQGRRLLSAFLLVFTRQYFSDPTSGFRAYSKRAIDLFAVDFPDEYPEVESIVLAKKAGLTIKEIPVAMAPRKAGTSSISFFGSIYYMVKVILASAIMTLRKY
jgi:glycosyltransferase involved in cell wall biosynthesis